MMMIHHIAVRTRSHTYQLNSKSEFLLKPWSTEDGVKLYIDKIWRLGINEFEIHQVWAFIKRLLNVEINLF